MPRVLIVAYGNPMRSDDGVAWRAAAALEGKFSTPEVEIICAHQLAPELAETVSGCETVIFVDAANNGPPGQICLAPVHPSQTAAGFTHELSPETLAALAQQLFGARFRAFSITVAGANFDHGDSLSSAVEAALPTLVARVEELVQQFLRGAAPSV
jgi:hydrogenase maturation protease